MIVKITWPEIYPVWRTKLWPTRVSDIEPTSCMMFMGGFEQQNLNQTPVFLGCMINSQIVGVNSGHLCTDGGFRSRGLWVDPEYRKQGIGVQLLTATIQMAQHQGAKFCWSLPRHSSWNVYERAGFTLASNWFPTETSEENAYCVKHLVK